MPRLTEFPPTARPTSFEYNSAEELLALPWVAGKRATRPDFVRFVVAEATTGGHHLILEGSKGRGGSGGG
jgi:predicted ATPase with chaperone activity